MASRDKKKPPQPRSSTSPSGGKPSAQSIDRSPGPEIVDPRWLLRAALAVVALAATCGFITVCIAFYKTQWQIVLHPSRVLARTPAALSLPFEEVRFSPGADGQPQLQGWWIPSENPQDPAAILLHGGDGNMADALSLAASLHRAQLNVLVFDYRGFGQSAGDHPVQSTMQQDASAALSYVHEGRHIPLDAILPVGEGLGASLAVHLASAHSELPALILSSPRGDMAEEAKLATRSHLVPFALLFHERFPLADALHTLATPKLILSQSHGSPSELAMRAADPKMTVEGLEGDSAALQTSLRRFLGVYVARPPRELFPSPSATKGS